MVRRPLPDDLDRRILAELENDARTSRRKIARRLGVSPPTVGYRIRRMEEAGLIKGYRVEAVEFARARKANQASAPMTCAHCHDPIHGPAVTGRFWGRSYAFCCRICNAAFAKRFPSGQGDQGGRAALVVSLGWIASFALLSAGCVGTGPGCLGSTASAHPLVTPCPSWARPRAERLACWPGTSLWREVAGSRGGARGKPIQTVHMSGRVRALSIPPNALMGEA
jgi:hypothetical protein